MKPTIAMSKIVESPHIVALRAMSEPRKVEDSALSSLSTADHEANARRLDTVAGSEFLDDRIRLEE